MVSKIGKGIMCLVGIRDNDDKACADVLAKKILVIIMMCTNGLGSSSLG